MSLFSIFLIALALAMDAFSIAVSKGLCCTTLYVKDAAKIGITFGAFQAIMPLIGWITASRFSNLITNYSDIISFALLSFIGLKMIYEYFKTRKEAIQCEHNLTFRTLIVYGVATSIDALAVGITFSMRQIELLTILLYCTIIGIVSLICSFVGYFLGNNAGSKIGKNGEVFGGLVLILIGVYMLF